MEIIKSLDILSCKRNNLLGRLIRFFTKGRFNHTALVVEIWGEFYIIDSQIDGTNLRPYQEWAKKYKYEYVIHRHKSYDVNYFKRTLSKRAISKSGHTKYDFASLFWFYPRYIFTGKWKGKRVQNAEERMYCSEFVSWVYDIPYWWKQSPQSLYEYLEKSKDFKEIK